MTLHSIVWVIFHRMAAPKIAQTRVSVAVPRSWEHTTGRSAPQCRPRYLITSCYLQSFSISSWLKITDTRSYHPIMPGHKHHGQEGQGHERQSETEVEPEPTEAKHRLHGSLCPVRSINPFDVAERFINQWDIYIYICKYLFIYFIDCLFISIYLYRSIHFNISAPINASHCTAVPGHLGSLVFSEAGHIAKSI